MWAASSPAVMLRRVRSKESSLPLIKVRAVDCDEQREPDQNNYHEKHRVLSGW